MKDIFGQVISIGDVVAFNPPSYKGLIRGKVTGFTPQKVRVDYPSSYHRGTMDKTTVFPSDLAVKPILIINNDPKPETISGNCDGHK